MKQTAMPPPRQTSGPQDDRVALDALYRRLAPLIRRHTARRGCAACAEDVTQEAFRRFLEHPERFAGKSTIEAHLMAIANNVMHEYRRQCRRDTSPPPSSDALFVSSREPHREIEDQEAIQRLGAAFSKLPPEQARTLQLVYGGELRPREAARVAGCTEKALRCRLDRARRRLREMLAALVPLPWTQAWRLIRMQWAAAAVTVGVGTAMGLLAAGWVRPQAHPPQKMALPPASVSQAPLPAAAGPAASGQPQPGAEAMRPRAPEAAEEKFGKPRE